MTGSDVAVDAHPHAEGAFRASARARRPGRHSLPRVVLRGLVGAWIVAGVVAGTSVIVGHSVARPRPAPAATVAATSSSAAAADAAGSWSTLHVLYATCRCSESIFAHLFRRGPMTGATERIVLVATKGAADATGAAGLVAAYRAKAAAAGFAVETVSSDDLARRFGVEGAPLLVVADPTGRIRYAGSYTDRKPGLDIRDTAIIADLMAGRASTELPRLASSVNERLQEALRPPPTSDRRRDD